MSKRKRHKSLQKVLGAVSAAAVLTVFAASGLLARADNKAADLLYQRPQALDGNIVLISIDERALNQLGPFQTWEREVLAQAVERLNVDSEYRPIAIGLDIIFAGETEPTADARLAQAAETYGNVVCASSVQFGAELVTEPKGTFYMDEYAVLGYDEPYATLQQSTAQGHVNAMYDADGVLRRAIWDITLPDGRVMPSFYQQLYAAYSAFYGIELYVPPLDKNRQWLLPFRAYPGGYDDGYSIADLLAGDLPADIFADKLVLIGPYAAGLQDSYITAIEHAAPMYGVEFQANAIDALIAQDGKYEVNRTWQLFGLFLILLLLALWMLDRGVLQCFAAWGTVCVLSVAGAVFAFQHGWVIRPLYLPLMTTILFVGSVALNYTRATIAKRLVTGVFRRYVAPEIVSELLCEDVSALELGGKEVEIAVLFVDLRGFTAMSEAMQPEQVVQILNRYLSMTTACVFANGGTLDKFIGDCTMAIWGAPLPRVDSAYCAVCAAIEMIESAARLNAELTAQFGCSISFGIGVHFGPAIVGNIGAKERMEYTAIGDTVNTAARLEAAAQGGTVLVSRAVADALGERAVCTPLSGPLQLKGKTQAFEAFIVERLTEKNKQ